MPWVTIAGRHILIGAPGTGAGHLRRGKIPPTLKWKPPPPPRGRPGGRAGGFTATGATNTSLGDLGEAVTRELGMRSLLPEGKRQNPLDAEWDHSGYGFEIKTVTTESTEYKAKMKGHEVEEKVAYAKENGLKPGMMILVMDAKAGEAHAYWREGIGNYRLPTGPEANGWNYMGSVRVKEKK